MVSLVEVVHSHGGGGFAIDEEVGSHLSLALDLDLASTLELVMVVQNIMNIFGALSLIGQASRVHSRSHIHRVTPDVVLRLPGSNDSGHDGANVDANPQHKVVVRVFIDQLKLFTHAKDVFDQLAQVGDGTDATIVLVIDNLEIRNESNGGHVSGSNGLDLVHGSESIFGNQLQDQKTRP